MILRSEVRPALIAEPKEKALRFFALPPAEGTLQLATQLLFEHFRLHELLQC